VVSLLLCVATSILWFRSYAVFDRYDRRHASQSGLLRRIQLVSSRGGFALVVEDWSRGESSWAHEYEFDGHWIHFPRPGSYAGEDVYALGDLSAPLTTLNRLGLYGAWEVSESGKNGVSMIEAGGITIDRMRSIGIAIPYWLLVLVALVMPLSTGYRLLRRHGVGCCPACSYNLTGNMSGTCPECGTPVPNKSEAIA
jgi:hypothetical protein